MQTINKFCSTNTAQAVHETHVPNNQNELAVPPCLGSSTEAVVCEMKYVCEIE